MQHVAHFSEYLRHAREDQKITARGFDDHHIAVIQQRPAIADGGGPGGRDQGGGGRGNHPAGPFDARRVRLIVKPQDGAHDRQRQGALRALEILHRRADIHLDPGHACGEFVQALRRIAQLLQFRRCLGKADGQAGSVSNGACQQPPRLLDGGQARAQHLRRAGLQIAHRGDFGQVVLQPVRLGPQAGGDIGQHHP